MNPKKLFNGLIRSWHFKRVLQNQLEDGVAGDVSGTAFFTKLDAQSILYQEKGLFRTNIGRYTNIFQEYIYKYDEDHQAIEKIFSENGKKTRLFYTLNLDFEVKNGLAKADGFHLCSQDKYFAEYLFVGEKIIERFDLTYRVSGPKKSYISSTTFTHA